MLRRSVIVSDIDDAQRTFGINRESPLNKMRAAAWGAVAIVKVGLKSSNDSKLPINEDDEQDSESWDFDPIVVAWKSAPLSPMCGLTHLSLINAGITDVETKVLANLIRHDRRVQWLDLYCNSIGDTGAAELGIALQHNATLQELWFGSQVHGGNMIGPKGCTSFVQHLANNIALKVLSLCNNPIGNDGATAIAAMLDHNSTIEQLWLGSCGINYTGAVILKHAKDKRKSTTTLNAKVQNHLAAQISSVISSGVKTMLTPLQNSTTMTNTSYWPDVDIFGVWNYELSDEEEENDEEEKEKKGESITPVQSAEKVDSLETNDGKVKDHLHTWNSLHILKEESTNNSMIEDKISASQIDQHSKIDFSSFNDLTTQDLHVKDSSKQVSSSFVTFKGDDQKEDNMQSNSVPSLKRQTSSRSTKNRETDAIPDIVKNRRPSIEKRNSSSKIQLEKIEAEFPSLSSPMQSPLWAPQLRRVQSRRESMKRQSIVLPDGVGSTNTEIGVKEFQTFPQVSILYQFSLFVSTKKI